jgi:hypothetical protein
MRKDGGDGESDEPTGGYSGPFVKPAIYQPRQEV